MLARADTNCHDIFNFVSATWTHLAKIGAARRVVPTCPDMLATFPAKIVVIHSSSSPSHHRHPIVVVVLDDVNVDAIVIIVVVVVTAVVFHFPIVVVAIATILLLASLSLLSPLSSTSSLVVVVLVVLLGCQSKEFDRSKPRRYRPWHGDGAPPLGFAVGWPTALLGRHLVKDVVLSEISWC